MLSCDFLDEDASSFAVLADSIAHLIIDRDMACSNSSVSGEGFYGAYDAQDFAKENPERLGVTSTSSTPRRRAT